MMDDDLRIPPPGYRSSAERRAEDMKRMVMLGVVAGVALLVCVIGYFVVVGGGSGTIPVVQAPATPVKEKPANPGGLAIQTPTGVLPSGSGGQGVSLAPAPEAPDPSALAAEARQEQPPAPVPAPAAAPQTSQPATAATAAQQAAAMASAAAAASAASPTVAVRSVPETAAVSHSKKTEMDSPSPRRETAKAHDLAREYRAEDKAQGHGEGVKVQLAALDSKAAAEREWEHLTHHKPALFAGRHPLFVEAKVDGKTYWRLRLAGFRSTAQAAAFCQDVRAQGGACAVAAF